MEGENITNYIILKGEIKKDFNLDENEPVILISKNQAQKFYIIYVLGYYVQGEKKDNIYFLVELKSNSFILEGYDVFQGEKLIWSDIELVTTDIDLEQLNKISHWVKPPLTLILFLEQGLIPLRELYWIHVIEDNNFDTRLQSGYHCLEKNNTQDICPLIILGYHKKEHKYLARQLKIKDNSELSVSEEGLLITSLGQKIARVKIKKSIDYVNNFKFQVERKEGQIYYLPELYQFLTDIDSSISHLVISPYLLSYYPSEDFVLNYHDYQNFQKFIFENSADIYDNLDYGSENFTSDLLIASSVSDIDIFTDSQELSNFIAKYELCLINCNVYYHELLNTENLYFLRSKNLDRYYPIEFLSTRLTNKIVVSMTNPVAIFIELDKYEVETEYDLWVYNIPDKFKLCVGRVVIEKCYYDNKDEFFSPSHDLYFNLKEIYNLKSDEVMDKDSI